MSRVIPFPQTRRVKVTRDHDGLYAFGGCPVCHRPLLTYTDGSGPDISGTDTLRISREDYGACYACGVYWFVGCGNFALADGETTEGNIKKLESLRLVEPWFPGSEVRS